MERYVSAAEEISLADEIARLGRVAGECVQLLLTLYTPEEESCLHVFDAPSLALLEHASREAGVLFDRVSPVIRIGRDLVESQRIGPAIVNARIDELEGVGDD